MKMTKIFKGALIALLGIMCISQAVLAQAPPEARATFLVAKAYDDFNPAPVEVTISCNTGLPLEQSKEIDPSYNVNDPEFVEFVVVDFESGTLDCEIFETVPAGYLPLYITVDENVFTQTEEPCVFEDVEHGDVAAFSPPEGPFDNLCGIGNFPIPSVVTVTKEWIDENPQFNAVNFGEATYSCTNLPDVDFVVNIIVPITGADAPEGLLPSNGFLEFFGNPGQDSFLIFGNWDGGTQCTVTETFVEGGIESDDSDCANLVIFPGEDAECTIVNTRLFEGIPTLSQYGLAVLAMLMLGLGLVAYRRFI